MLRTKAAINNRWRRRRLISATGPGKVKLRRGDRRQRPRGARTGNTGMVAGVTARMRHEKAAPAGAAIHRNENITGVDRVLAPAYSLELSPWWPCPPCPPPIPQLHINSGELKVMSLMLPFFFSLGATYISLLILHPLHSCLLHFYR